MLTYLPNDPLPGGKYTFSYGSLREDYLRYTMMSDEEFIDNIPEILHFACYACYIKEAPSYIVLSDTGIIHELIHLSLGNNITATPLHKIRDAFNLWCCLA